MGGLPVWVGMLYEKRWKPLVIHDAIWRTWNEENRTFGVDAVMWMDASVRSEYEIKLEVERFYT